MNLKSILKQFVVIFIAVSGLVVASVAFAKTINLGSSGDTINVRGSMDLNSNDISNVGTMEASTYTGDGCDLAEYYRLEDGQDTVEPGDIMVMSLEGDNTVVKSRKAYDRMVMGAISAEPAVLIGKNKEVKNDPDEYEAIALAGRIPVKVTDENGSIERGDSIVASSKAGYGMKCDDLDKCYGAVIGKAMESLDKGEGKIDVLVK